MASVSAITGAFTLKAYRGDRKTLLAFNLERQSDTTNLAGFTIHCQPENGAAGDHEAAAPTRKPDRQERFSWTAVTVSFNTRGYSRATVASGRHAGRKQRRSSDVHA